MKGFTLIELLIAVAIVAMLASVAVPLNELVVQRAKEQDLRRALRDLRDGIDAYKQAADEGRVAKRPGESGYPRRLQDLVSGVEDEKNPKRARIHFLRRIPRDPFAEDSQVAAAESWGIRSYASPPDAPRDGEDVFDVFSLSTARGLNGRPYRDW
jgi:general secretion pathway protein G